MILLFQCSIGFEQTTRIFVLDTRTITPDLEAYNVSKFPISSLRFYWSDCWPVVPVQAQSTVAKNAVRQQQMRAPH